MGEDIRRGVDEKHNTIEMNGCIGFPKGIGYDDLGRGCLSLQ
jgi:hypothetical protein